MLLIVVAAFTFCWLPYEVYLVLNEISGVSNVVNKYVGSVSLNHLFTITGAYRSNVD